MKTLSLTLFLFLIAFSANTQQSGLFYFGRTTPVLQTDGLPVSVTVSELIPDLWLRLAMPYTDRLTLENRRKQEYAVGCYLYPELGYEFLVDVVSLEIKAITKGISSSAKGNSDRITAEQRTLIASADAGTDLRILLTYALKDKETQVGTQKTITGTLSLTASPAHEAKFPGGFNGMTKYLMDHIIAKVATTKNTDELMQTIVKFIVDEQGKITGARIVHTSSDPKTDQLILKAINQMPDWQPAENADRKRIQQEITIPFGGGMGC